VSLDASPTGKTTSEQQCPFCTLVLAGHDRPLLATTALAVAFEDAFPSSPGHVLVIPRRHVGRVHELTGPEHAQLWELARTVLLAARDREGSGVAPGYTIGVNDGPAAGQTVAHVHLHIIARYPGDNPDPRGGLRVVIPATAKYWS